MDSRRPEVGPPPQIVLISDRRTRPIEDLWRIVEESANAGLTALMIREKDLLGRPLLEIARRAIVCCRPLGVSVIVNDRVDVALAAGADGVHLGIAAMSVDDARRVAGDRLRIGASTHSLEELASAEAQGADYAMFGPVFETTSRTSFGPPVGVETLAAAVRSTRLPVLALGGVTPERAELLAGTGVAGIAAISAILLAVDPRGVVAALASALRRAVRV